AHAVDHELLLLIGARQAVEPLAVGELGRDVARLAELDVGLGGRTGGHLGVARPGQRVARGADRDRVLAGRQAVGREAVVALVVGDYRDGDGRAFLPGVDQHTFHV